MSGSLATAVEELKGNDRQWEAFTTEGHCVVLAPPGSGKTKLLTTRMAADLVSGAIQPPRGAACITMTNESALELRRRLRGLGIGHRPNLFVGTVHSFALACIVGPLAMPAGAAEIETCRIASQSEQSDAFSKVFKASAFRPDERDEIKTTMNRARQLLDLSGDPLLGGQSVADMALAYQAELLERGLYDFQDLVRHAVDLVVSHDWVPRVLAATFSRIYVDEYQDLPPGLDKLVRAIALRRAPHATLFAVGDPDQAIYGFTGTQPHLLHDLATEDGLTRVFLEKNYRCGQAIIDLSVRALGEDRSITGDHDGGSVNVYPAPGGEAAQAARAVEIIQQVRSEGVADDEIVVVAAWGKDRDQVVDLLREQQIPVFSRRDDYWRPTALTTLVELMASWSVRGLDAISDLYGLLEKWQTVVRTGDEHQVMTALVGSLLHAEPQAPAREFVESLVELMPKRLTADPGRSEDARELDRMRRAMAESAAAESMSIADLGDRARAVGRVLAATIHGAKGLEFDVVVMVGVDEVCLPGFNPTPEDREEARRKFYVSMTRARHHVHLVHTDSRISRRGRPYDVRPSPFLAELEL